MLIKTDTDMVVRNLRGLASAGFHVELDDFGTGHASIANLRRFMVNRIKIDRSFIAGIETSEEQQTLTASMIAMAHALGIGTLAEGVETEAAAGDAGAPRLRQLPGLPRGAPDVAAPTASSGSPASAGIRGASATRGQTAGGDPNTP